VECIQKEKATWHLFCSDVLNPGERQNKEEEEKETSKFVINNVS
jgi:hypothetical protein